MKLIDKIKSNNKYKAIAIAILLVVLCALGAGGYYGYRYYTEEILPGKQYEQAVSYRDDGRLDDAIEIFSALGDYSDAAEQVLETRLMKARNQIDGGAYEDALTTLDAVGDYEGTGDLRTQDLRSEANQNLSDIAYAQGLIYLKVYDYTNAAEQFRIANDYVARDDAAGLAEACENAFDAVYEASFAEGRDDGSSEPMTLYLWAHSVITEGEPLVQIGMQSDLSTGSVNSNVFGQSYMNYVYYDAPSAYMYTFSYAGSEKDADDESRQVFLMAAFAEDFAQVTTSKIYADTGEVPAAPEIRIWRLVSDNDVSNAVRTGIRNKLTMNLITLGELEEDPYGTTDYSFTAFKAADDGFTLRTSEEISAEEQAAAEEYLQNSEEATADQESTEDAVTESADEAASVDNSADSSEDSAAADDAGEDSTEDAAADSTADEEETDYASMTEEERKAKAEELADSEKETRIAAQEAAAENITSDYAIMIDADTGEILVDKDADALMYPASMTKIMTILIAAENVTDLTQRAEITQDMLAYCTEHTLTVVGFRAGEKATIADLMWGTALASGADAAKALANAVAGSETNFVDLMNAKVTELGLTGTHFANCTGVYSDDNYTTPHDMALILHAATQNPLARTVLSTRQYTTSFTEQHPAGITITNSFLRNMDQDQLPGIVLSAKTGFVTQSMYCAASYMIADDGERYICVTGHADTSAACRADHASLYSAFAEPASHSDMEKYLEEILSGESVNANVITADDTDDTGDTE